MPQPQERMSTCVVCRRFRTGISSMTQKHSKCPGKFVPWGIQKRAWVRIQEVPDVAEKLLRAWRITKEEADQAFGLLVQQGIEPHPGPGGRSRRNIHGVSFNAGPTTYSTLRKTISCVSLNTGGAIGVWKALENLLQRDIVALQEVCLSKAELRAVQLSAGRKGYRSYHSPGTPTEDIHGNFLPLHGVLTLVRKELPQKEIDSTRHDDNGAVFQTVVVQIADWIHINTYTPPRSAHMDVLKQCGIPSSRPWVWCGDFNRQLSQGPFSTLALTCQGTPIQGLHGANHRSHL